MSRILGMPGAQEVQGMDGSTASGGPWKRTSGALGQVSRAVWASGVYRGPAAYGVCAERVQRGGGKR